MTDPKSPEEPHEHAWEAGKKIETKQARAPAPEDATPETAQAGDRETACLCMIDLCFTHRREGSRRDRPYRLRRASASTPSPRAAAPAGAGTTVMTVVKYTVGV